MLFWTGTSNGCCCFYHCCCWWQRSYSSWWWWWWSRRRGWWCWRWLRETVREGSERKRDCERRKKREGESEWWFEWDHFKACVFIMKDLLVYLFSPCSSLFPTSTTPPTIYNNPSHTPFFPIWPLFNEMQSKGRHRASGEGISVAMLTCNLYRP